MKATTFKALDNPTIENIEKLLKEKLGDKYEIKLKKESSIAGKMIGGASYDQITVIKNAYHRTVVSLQEHKDPSYEGGKATFIYFSEVELAGWLGFLHDQVGFIGGIIIGLIYGRNDEIYDLVQNTITENLNVEIETNEVGLSALFKKKKTE